MSIFRLAGYTQGVFRSIQPIGMHYWYSGAELKYLHPAVINRFSFSAILPPKMNCTAKTFLFGMSIAPV